MSYSQKPDPEHHRHLIYRTDQKNESLAIFVHGIGQAHLNGWRPLPTHLSGNAINDVTLSNWDFLFFGYDSLNNDDFLSISSLLGIQFRDAIEGRGLFAPGGYRQIALFGFSLGTLVIRQFLASCEISGGTLTAIKSVTFFNSPIDGSRLSGLAPFAPLKRMSAALVHSMRRNSPQLIYLRAWSICALAHHAWPTIRSYYGVFDPVVKVYGIPRGWSDETTATFAGSHNIHELLAPPYGDAFSAIVDALR